VPALTAALAAAKTDRSRRAVTRALGEVGRPAAPAVPQIRPFLKSADADLREAADWALSQIEPDGPN
jgi:HEAT repeat protein